MNRPLPLSGKIDFNPNTRTVLLSVLKDDVDQKIVENFARAENLLLKSEFHITLIGRETGEELTRLGIDTHSIEKLVESFSWEFTLNPEFYFISKIVIAATILAVESLVFIGVHIKYRETTPIIMSAVLGILMVCIACGKAI